MSHFPAELGFFLSHRVNFLEDMKSLVRQLLFAVIDEFHISSLEVSISSSISGFDERRCLAKVRHESLVPTDLVDVN